MATTVNATTLQLARSHHDAGRLAEAADLYEKLLAMNPEDPEVLDLAGLTAFEQGNLGEAVVYFNQAVALNGAQAAYYAHQGAAYGGLGQLERAITAFRKAIELDPNSPDVYVNLGNAYRLSERYEDAIDNFRAALQLNPNCIEAHFNRAVTQRSCDEWDAALAGFREVIRIQPDSAKAHKALGNTLVSLKRSDDAERCFREALRLAPDDALVHCSLANLYYKQGRLEEAVDGFRQALQLKPEFGEALLNLGSALLALGRPEEAIGQYDRALLLDRKCAQAWNNKGEALRYQKRLGEAEQCLRRATLADPNYTDAYINLGNVLRLLGRMEDAVATYRDAIRLKPDFVEAYNNLASVLHEQRETNEAMEAYRRALEINPDYAEAHYNLGQIYRLENRHVEAIECFRNAVRIKPSFVAAQTVLGLSLQAAGEPEEAVASQRIAVLHQPENAEVRNNLGAALQCRGELAEASACFDHALRLKPGLAIAHVNRSLTEMRKGNMRAAWIEYEWRWRHEGYVWRDFPRGLWDGSRLEGRTILVHAEQGLGDTFQFVRYVPLLKAQGATVILETQPPLKKVLEGCPGADVVVARGEPLPRFDVHVPLLSLPGFFRTSLSSIPAAVPYLFADKELIQTWSQRLPGDSFNIGLGWQGNPEYSGDHFRSIALREFLPLSQVGGVRFFSLQKGAGTEQIAGMERLRVEEFPDLDARVAFVDTAALVMNLDLLITSDTALPHLAGALGVPVWLALPYSADWRWMMNCERCPWYPSMRMFRQPELRQWPAVFETMARELQAVVDGDTARLLPAEPQRELHLELPTAAGELLDKIATLEIKSEQIKDERKLANVRRELDQLRAARDRALPECSGLAELAAELKDVDRELLGAEDAIRAREQSGDFGLSFVELARSMRAANGRRSEIQRQINELTESKIIARRDCARDG